MSKTYQVTDIRWDTDGVSIDLPNRSTVTVPDGEDVEQYLSDWLSDETGFCHFGFKYEEESE